MTRPTLLVSCFAWSAWKAKKANQLPGSLCPDYKYLHARQISHQLSFSSQTILDCIRYIVIHIIILLL